jgi:CubicO group peptidase (beta-lactamase class C family)
MPRRGRTGPADGDVPLSAVRPEAGGSVRRTRPYGRAAAAVASAAAALLSAVGTPAPAAAQPGDAAARVAAIFAEFDRADSPGCAVGVAEAGRPVLRRGFGAANLDHGIAIGPTSAFYLASVSKQFTAAAVLLAAEQGHLSLDDDVRRHVPELPDYGRRITVRQLIHHTSGLRDYLTLLTLAGRPFEDVLTDESTLELIARQRALNFEPGTEFLYSNTGYVLLAEIVRRATGRSLRDYADAELFRPLGMGSTHFHDDAARVVPRRVIGYAPAGEQGVRISHLFHFDRVGDGGLYSTVDDLLIWLDNLSTGRVGGPELRDAMHRRGVLANGDTIAYAGGLTHGRHRGLRTVEHGGGLAGFRTSTIRYPDDDLDVVVLCNTAAANAPVLARRVGEVWLGGRMEPEAVAVPTAATSAWPPPAAAGDAGALSGYSGRYRSDELDAAYTLAVEADGLVVRRGTTRIPVRADGDDRFVGGMGLVLRFTRDAAGAVTGFTLDAGRVRGIVFARY